MFGQKDDQTDNAQSDTAQADSGGTDQPLTPDPGIDGAEPAPVGNDVIASQPTDSSWQQSVVTDADQNKDVISPAGGFPSSPNDRIKPGGEPEPETILPEPSIAYTPAADTSDSALDGAPADTALVSNDDVSDAELIDIKQKALSELIPLIDKLDQPPPEKFRTVMMMIQASDDQRLIEKAYESAHAIEDEEVRAQALLDIVNEINYFTQQPDQKTA